MMMLSHCQSCQVKDWFDSDHKPLVCRFGRPVHSTRQTQYQIEYPIRALNLTNKSFDKLSEVLEPVVDAEYSWSHDDADELYKQIYDVILFGLKQIGCLRQSKSRHRKPWFNDEIRQLIRQRDQARLDDSPDAHQKYVDLKKAVKRAVKKAKRQSWLDFVESIKYQDSAAKIWRKFRMSRGVDKPFDKYGDLDRQTQHIAKSFEKYSTVMLPKVQVWEHKYDQVRNSWYDDDDDTDDDNDDYNRCILATEVKNAIRMCKSTSAPGPDGIPYAVYKAIPDNLIHKITRLFNLWYDNGHMAIECDEGLQVAIPKGLPGDFRPITLKNAISKIYERVLYARIYSWIDARLPEYQFGFRRKMGCTDQLLRLINHLETQRRNKRTTVVLFLDIRKAYDRVYRKALIAKMHDYGLRGKMLRAIDRLISGTRCRVLNQGHVSDEYRPSDGIPQGGVTSCLIWNCFFSDLPYCQDDDVMYAAYADDLAIAVSASTEHEANLKLTSIYSHIRQWARHNRVEFNDSKVKSMLVRPKWHRKRKSTQHTYHLDRVLYLDEQSNTIRRVEVVSEYRYLGAILDDKLTLTSWINKIVQNTRRRISLVKRVASTMKLPRILIEKFYTGYVRGYLQYGIEVWSQTKSAHKVYSIDRAGQRMCSGLLHATRNTQVDWESNLIPLQHIAQYASIKIVHKSIRAESSVMTRIMKSIFDGVDPGPTLASVMHIWYKHDLPVLDTYMSSMMSDDDWSVVYDTVRQLKPVRPVQDWVYRESFWEEKVLSRFRAGVQPTQVWKKKVGLDWSDRCRHCEQCQETLEHLMFDECKGLSHKFELGLKFGIETIDDLREMMSTDNENRVELENHVVNVTRDNNLFARKAFDVH